MVKNKEYAACYFSSGEGFCIYEACSPKIQEEIDGSSYYVDDIFMEVELPKGTGPYIWEGCITYHTFNAPEFDGEWRRATSKEWLSWGRFNG